MPICPKTPATSGVPRDQPDIPASRPAAGIGDALVVDYGDGDDRHRVVVDGGVTKTSGTVRAARRDARDEMVMVSDIDNDHIAGMLKVPGPGGPADDQRHLVQRLPAPAQVSAGEHGTGGG